VNNVTALNRDSAGRTQTGAATPWKFYLAGTMRLVGPRGEDALPRPRKTRAMLAYLCLEHPKRQPRSRLMALLWEKPDRSARRNLRDALYQLEQQTGARGAGLICADNEFVWLNDDACWIDVFAEPSYSFAPLLEDLDGISEPFTDWLRLERRRFENRVRDTLETTLTTLIERKTPADQRLSAARKVVNFDPTHEDGVYALMVALADLGQHAQALREYDAFRAELHKELRISPSRKIEALYEAVRIASPRSSVTIKPARKAELIALNANSLSPPRGPEPSIAVLPFDNLSGGRRYDFVAEGLAEDLIRVLSRMPGFFVTSRQTTRTFRDKHRLPREIGELLNVRYILSGSMRLAGSRLVLSAELADAVRGVVLHAWPIEERFADLIDVQARLAEGIVREVAPYLRFAELKRVQAKPPDQLDAYDYFLRAQEAMHNASPIRFAEAERFFHEALRRDPTYAAALAWLAYWHVLRVGQGWSPDPALDARLAADAAQRAVDCDEFEPMAFAVQGHIATYLHKDFDQGFRHFDTARRINPNAAPAWLWSAAASAWVGEGMRSVEEASRATALSPYDPLMYAHSSVASVAHLAAGQNERAVELAWRAIHENPTYTAAYKQLIIALVLTGREQEARGPVERLLELEPKFTVETYRRRNPHISRHAERYYDAMKVACVPLHD
jgi:TolB-like protein